MNTATYTLLGIAYGDAEWTVLESDYKAAHITANTIEDYADEYDSLVLDCEENGLKHQCDEYNVDHGNSAELWFTCGRAES